MTQEAQETKIHCTMCKKMYLKRKKKGKTWASHEIIFTCCTCRNMYDRYMSQAAHEDLIRFWIWEIGLSEVLPQFILKLGSIHYHPYFQRQPVPEVMRSVEEAMPKDINSVVDVTDKIKWILMCGP